LNPSLKGHITPANYPNFQLKVPEEVDSDLHDKLDDLPAAKYKAPAEATLRYKVRKGDTLLKIASKYRVSVTELRKANHLSLQKKQLAAGTWLQIPSKSVEKAEPVVKKAQSKKTRSSKLIARKSGTSEVKMQTAKNTRSAKAKAKSSDSGKPTSKAAQKSATHQSKVKTASTKKKTHVKTDSRQIASR
jgi:LysM repeat protein